MPTAPVVEKVQKPMPLEIEKPHGPPCPTLRKSPKTQREVHPAPASQASTDSPPLEVLCAEILRERGFPIKSVRVETNCLKGGYICATRRLHIEYEDGADDGHQRPPTAVVKAADARCADHGVARHLKLYDREWHFYEEMNAKCAEALRCPRYYGTLSWGGEKHGVIMEDLDCPGAVLNPKLDTEGVLVTVDHCARMHALFWNNPNLEQMGVQPHNGSWFNPSWRIDVEEYWTIFKPKWQERLGPERIAVGEKVLKHYQWIQDQVSQEPRTFLHGDVKPGNMFMVPHAGKDEKTRRWQGKIPAFIDWQYTAIGKGCCDLVFFVVEGYTEEECARLEPIIKAGYLESLRRHGVTDYSAEELDRDWKIAMMYFPFYVAMWFGTVADEDLVDPSFPRRYAPRCFTALQRAVDALPS
eukprot:TRINITY_DN19283_c0_g1_i1.p1 TRINITY_DN19283_c0_g1~~TRINITY_DN19283_c0_g1_i1.p1  ORF type:complete len:413 (+),score=107.14 TRINITY_DN19283_c0_g1_i1:93-1331(+)